VVKAADHLRVTPFGEQKRIQVELDRVEGQKPARSVRQRFAPRGAFPKQSRGRSVMRCQFQNIVSACFMPRVYCIQDKNLPLVPTYGCRLAGCRSESISPKGVRPGCPSELNRSGHFSRKPNDFALSSGVQAHRNLLIKRRMCSGSMTVAAQHPPPSFEASALGLRTSG